MTDTTLALALFAVSCALGLLCLLLVAWFSCTTVRRLRANPRTAERLGVEWTHGWAALNVAMALAWPRRLMLRLDHDAQAALHAPRDLLQAHTTRLDRLLARACYAAQLFTCLSFVLWLCSWWGS